MYLTLLYGLLHDNTQAAHPPQGGVMSAGQRQEQAFALAQGLQVRNLTIFLLGALWLDGISTTSVHA